LHTEGVEAGRQDAEQLRKAAAAEATAVTARAEEAGRRLIAEAELKAQAIIAEGRGELALAVRDAQLELREKLSRALTSLLRESVERELSDPKLVRELLREIVGAYARADGAGEIGIEVRVRPELVEELEASVPSALGRALADRSDAFDLKGVLRSAGFEYRIRDAVVEVTPESVAEKLAELLTPRMRAQLREASGEEDALVPAGGDDRPAPWIKPGAHSGTKR
jgi:V/A-type H+-transporting ATPase subunit E